MLMQLENKMMEYAKEQQAEIQSETIKNAITVMKIRIMKQFSLLIEGQREILRKISSQDNKSH